MPRVAIHTLGCKLNFAESSTIERQFTEAGYSVVPFGQTADVTVINTCSVTQEADRKCGQIIRRARRTSPSSVVVVTGCFAQLDPDRVSAIPGVDLVAGMHRKFSLVDLVRDFEPREQTQVDVSCIDHNLTFQPSFSSTDRTRAFMKVQDGCDYTCSFCTIPVARGASRSQSIEDCVTQASELASMGFREIVLSGVNVGLFGQQEGATLLDLLRALDEVDGIRRYRISSIEPNLVTDEIIDFVATSRRFQPHFHLPLQSGDDYVLGKMRRRYRSDRYRDRVLRIRETIPHACIGVDVIVGFPAESQERFDNTRAFLADLPVSYLHVFTYSHRPLSPLGRGTARIDADEVPAHERSRRNRSLRTLSDRLRRQFYESQRGTVREVLWESPDSDGRQFGFSDNYVKLLRSSGPAKRGAIERVRLGDFAAPDTLLAEAV